MDEQKQIQIEIAFTVSFKPGGEMDIEDGSSQLQAAIDLTDEQKLALYREALRILKRDTINADWFRRLRHAAAQNRREGRSALSVETARLIDEAIAAALERDDPPDDDA